MQVKKNKFDGPSSERQRGEKGSCGWIAEVFEHFVLL